MAKKKAAAAQEDVGSIFDHFARVGRDVKPDEPRKDVSPEVQQLLARIEAQDRMLEAMKGTGPEPQYPMVTRTEPKQTGGYVDPAKLRVNLDGLPDRDVDPAGYDREYTLRVNAAIQAQTEAVSRNMTQKFEQERAAERLWNGFKEKHPQWAKYESLVETVTNRVALDLQNKGVDLQRFMTGSPDAFYKEVVSALDQQYGKLVKEDTEEGEEEEVEEIDPTDPSRVADLGDRSTPAQKRSASRTGPNSGDMFDDLRAVQKRMGIL